MSSALQLPAPIVVRQQPLVLRWVEPDDPLPRRLIVQTASRRLPFSDAPPWLPTGPRDQPFDFSSHMRRLCHDISERCPQFRHIAVPRLLFAATQARNGRGHGLQARVTPLRFHGGSLIRKRHGITYQVQRYFLGSQEFLYLVNFCLPRFLDQTFDDKLVTVFHELYHISPEFNGDLRRHAGRYCVHSHSQKGYDREMGLLAKSYLAVNPDPTLLAFLRLNFAQLQRRHGGVAGIVVPRPKMIPIGGRFLESDVLRQESAQAVEGSRLRGREQSLSHERESERNAQKIVHGKNDNSGSANRSASDKQRTMPTEVPRPFVAPRIEQRHELAGHRINPRNVGSLVAVAV